jgi:GntR family transcriptional regulator, arabinose operon transcriptional repressor
MGSDSDIAGEQAEAGDRPMGHARAGSGAGGGKGVQTKFVPLYEQVARKIEQQIEKGRFVAGQKIYTIREICSEFGVSDVTAKNALKVLDSRGVIKSIVGSGTYVQDRSKEPSAAQTRRQTFAFLKVGMSPVPIFSYGIDLIQQELSKAGFTMTYNVAAKDESVAGVVEQIKQAGAGGLIVFPPHRGDFEEAGFMADVRRAGMPVLVVETASERDASVVTDVELATRDLVDHLYELGHRNICLATGYRRKVAGFKAAVARINDPKLVATVMENDLNPGHATHDLVAGVLGIKPRPTAVIAGDDHAAALMISGSMGFGLRVPEDISVVGFDDHPDLARLSPIAVTVVRHPCLEVAQEVAAWARMQVSGPVSMRRMHRKIRGTLIARDSSGPVAAEDRR